MQESETGKLGKEREENEKKIKKTKVFDIFGGIIKTVVECLNCNHKSITTERYYDFNIVLCMDKGLGMSESQLSP